MDQAKAGAVHRQLVAFDELFDQHYERVLCAVGVPTIGVVVNARVPPR